MIWCQRNVNQNPEAKRKRGTNKEDKEQVWALNVECTHLDQSQEDKCVV